MRNDARRRVLVIDDQPEVCARLQKVLQRSGYWVSTAWTGEDGLELLQKESVDLIIVDKNLPRMHGGEVILNARKLRPQLAVILMSASPEPFSIPPERFHGYLAKPFKSLKAVEEAVKQALEAADAARLGFGERFNQVFDGLVATAKKRL